MTWNPPPALSGRMDLSKSTKEEKFHAKKKNTRKSIDTSISYQVIGIDLAKHLVSACLITGAGEIFGIDRLTYDDLLKSAERMSPTLFCMEPCPEVHYLAEKLQGYGHHTKVIDGAAVKEYIKTHFGGQKTDLNDAQAIAFLSLDTNLPEITPKIPLTPSFLPYKLFANSSVKNTFNHSFH